MSYFFWESGRWLSSALCCRYLVVRFDTLRVPTRHQGSVAGADWHWAIGLFADGQFDVLGAWRDEGAGTPQRIAADLHHRGIERIKALAGTAVMVAGMGRLRPEACPLGPRMRQAVHWTDTAAQRLQDRMQRVVRNHGPFDDDAAAADVIAQAFQRADRDLLHDRWDRKHPAPYGQGAFVASLAAAA